LKKIFNNKFIIAVVYLRPTLGHPEHRSMQDLINCALSDCQKLVTSGVDGILLENEYDYPYDVLASESCISSMIEVCTQVKKEIISIPIGVEFLLNDPKASLLIAKTSGLDFIRTDYFVDRMKRDEYGGEMLIDPVGLINYRNDIHANNIHIFTDLQVKYATMLISRSIKESAELAVKHQSDGVIISSDITGTQPDVVDLKDSKVDGTPVLVGSGLSLENLGELFPHFDGAMIGSSIMDDGVINESKAIKFMLKVKSLRQSK
jgi:uncharacterized protein